MDLRLFKPGDVIGFSGGDRLGAAINLGTLGWPLPWPAAWRGLSHVAIVADGPFHLRGRLTLWESTTLCDDLPCLVNECPVSGVQCHEVDERIRWYHRRGGSVWHYPLRLPLSDVQSIRLTGFCWANRDKDYDYLGAFDSRATMLARARRKLLGREDLASLFCSEFCAAALRSARAWRVENVSGYSPNSFVRAAIRDSVLSYPGRLYPASAEEFTARAAS